MSSIRRRRMGESFLTGPLCQPCQLRGRTSIFLATFNAISGLRFTFSPAIRTSVIFTAHHTSERSRFTQPTARFRLFPDRQKR